MFINCKRVSWRPWVIALMRLFVTYDPPVSGAFLGGDFQFSLQKEQPTASYRSASVAGR